MEEESEYPIIEEYVRTLRTLQAAVLTLGVIPGLAKTITVAMKKQIGRIRIAIGFEARYSPDEKELAEMDEEEREFWESEGSSIEVGTDVISVDVFATIEDVVESYLTQKIQESKRGYGYEFVFDKKVIELYLHYETEPEFVDYSDGIPILGFGKKYNVDKNASFVEVWEEAKEERKRKEKEKMTREIGRAHV